MIAETARREAMKPFTFSDGTKVNVGDTVCTPVKPVMQNPTFYPSPQQFSGFRFAPQEALDKLGAADVIGDSPRQPQPSKFTDIDPNWHVFGAGRINW